MISESTIVSSTPLLSSLNSKNTSFNKRQILILTILLYGNFCVAACVSLQAPFFPRECELKSVSSKVYGLIFGIYELMIISTSPIFGRIIAWLSPRIIMDTGLFIAGLTTILFGILDKVSSRIYFTSFALILRILEGAGAAAFLTSSYSIMAAEFTDSLLETSFGIGLIVGPTLGGILFDLNGYYLPFAFLGGCMVFASILSCIFMPYIKVNDIKNTNNWLIFYSDVGLLIDILAISTCLNVIGFNAAALTSQLKPFELSAVKISLIFIINGLTYGISGPFLGYICQKMNESGISCKFISIFGTIINCIGLLFLGPVSYIPIEPQIWIICSSLVVLGLGIAAKLIGSYSATLYDTVKRRNYPDNISTYGMVSSMFFVANSIGAFIGPSVGGWLLEVFGYRVSTEFLLYLEFFTLLSLVFYLTIKRRQRTSEFLYSRRDY